MTMFYLQEIVLLIDLTIRLASFEIMLSDTSLDSMTKTSSNYITLPILF